MKLIVCLLFLLAYAESLNSTTSRHGVSNWERNTSSCRTSYVLWNLPRSGSHFFTETLEATLPRPSVQAFEFNVRLKEPAEVKTRMAVECLVTGKCPRTKNDCRRQSQRHQLDRGL